MNKHKRFFALILALVMILGLFPSAAMATEGTQYEEAEVLPALNARTLEEPGESAPHPASSSNPVNPQTMTEYRQGTTWERIADFDFSAANLDNGAFRGAGAVAYVRGTTPFTFGTMPATFVPSGSDSFATFGTGRWLEVTNADGSALLQGRDHFIISYDVNATGGAGSTNRWAFFAQRTVRPPMWSWEHYLGILERSADISVQRIHARGQRVGGEGIPGSRNNRTGLLIDYPTIAGETGAWRNVQVVFEPGRTMLYVNGQLRMFAASEYTPSEILSAAGGFFSIGRAPWGSGEFFAGSLANFRVYVPEAPSIAEQVAEAAEALILPNALQQTPVRGNIHLPEEGLHGTTITWATSHSDIIDVNRHEIVNYDPRLPGTVTRPTVDTNVTLTATISSGSVSETRTFELTVKAAPAPLDDTEAYLFVAFTGTEGTQTDEQVYFAVSEDAMTWRDISPRGRPVLASDQGDRGVRDPWVIRSPYGDKFYLIATDLSINRRGGWGSANWQNSSTKLAVWESYDLVNWSDVRLVDFAGTIPDAGNAWAPEVVWDPVTGDYFVFWATMTTADDPRPQTHIDRNHSGPFVFYSRTRDFHSFSPAALWMHSDPALTPNNLDLIDTSAMLSHCGTYWWRAARDDRAAGNAGDRNTLERSLDTVTINGQDFPSLTGEWELISVTQEIFTGAWPYGAVEGPALFLLNEQDWVDNTPTYGMLLDRFGQGAGYRMFRTTNLSCALPHNHIDSAWESLDIDMGPVMKRHGGVLTITQAEHDRILAQLGEYTGGTDHSDDKPLEWNQAELIDNRDLELIAAFDFDDVTPGSTYIESSTGDAVAYSRRTRPGVPHPVNLVARDGGYAFSLGGTGGSGARWLDVVRPDGSALLQGAHEFVITFDLNRTSGNWPVYIDRNQAQNVFQSENYIGVMTSDTTMTVERFSGGRTGATATAGAGNFASAGPWQEVALVVRPRSTAIYINGTRVGQSTTTDAERFSLPTIFGPTGGYVQLGKSNWTAGGEFFTGLIDNVKIYAGYTPPSPAPTELVRNIGALTPTVHICDVRQSVVPYSDMITFRELNPYRRTANLVVSASNLRLSHMNAGIPERTGLARVPLSFDVADGVTVAPQLPYYDLRQPIEITFTYDDVPQTWTITAELASNPILPGRFADPTTLIVHQGRYWMFGTTDGHPGWSSNVFQMFSSLDMVNWDNEGPILHFNNPRRVPWSEERVPVQPSETYPNPVHPHINVGMVPWASHSAWAPSIYYKDGMFFSYFSGHCYTSNNKELTVAWAPHPIGPWETHDQPMMRLTEARAELGNLGGTSMGQTIDPEIYSCDGTRCHVYNCTDVDARRCPPARNCPFCPEIEVSCKSFMFFGNGQAAIIDLTLCMRHFVPGTGHRFAEIAPNFREAIKASFIDGWYHFTWSDDDTGSINYRVYYGISRNLHGPILQKGLVMYRDASVDIMGAAHHNIFFHPETEEWYITNHRFWTPLGQWQQPVYNGGWGNHREIVIEPLPYRDGSWLPTVPTHRGLMEPLYLQAWKDDLARAIADAEKFFYAQNAADFCEDLWEALEEALATGRDVYDDENVTQREVDPARDAIDAALNALWRQALVDVVDYAEDKIEADYTPETWEEFEDALEEAERVLANPAATRDEIIEAKLALNEAIRNLEPLGTAPHTISWALVGGAWSGEFTPPATVADGGTIAAIAEANLPTRDGFTFAGWAPELPLEDVTGPVTVTAQWDRDGDGMSLILKTVTAAPGESVEVSLSVENNVGLSTADIHIEFADDDIELVGRRRGLFAAPTFSGGP
ncbi:MAG: family 43 glycosylhydrolase, partial [Oscillospiraceae bacterium]|nr:family 43 glycosylhydrolase [Oscillospiraceae bacterium]